MRHEPVVEILRGGVLESVHFGSVAVADAQGRLLASWGDPQMVSFLRSSAKPFQALPTVESGAVAAAELQDDQIALLCGSHSGMDIHAEGVARILQAAGLDQRHLQCGSHPPFDAETAKRLEKGSEPPTPLRHNCSGKHAGMLLLASHLGEPVDSYLDRSHPVQQRILQVFAEMCGLEPSAVAVGTDGCSAPNFAVPLQATATAFARLADPSGMADERAAACRRIFRAMTAHPEMVAGPGRFDTLLMQSAGGALVSKGGAEGYQAIGVRAGTRTLGVAIKIAEGDQGRRAGAPTALEVLEQLDLQECLQAEGLAQWKSPQALFNHRGITVGQLRTCLSLKWHSPPA